MNAARIGWRVLRMERIGFPEHPAVTAALPFHTTPIALSGARK